MLTLEELENQLLSMKPVEDAPTPSIVKKTVVFRNYEKIPESTNVAKMLKNKTAFSKFMTTQEKQLMAKIQIKQLTTDNKYLDDYYFDKFNEKSKNSLCSLASESSKDLSLQYLLTKQQTSKAKTKKKAVAISTLESTLGKASVSSVRAHRKIAKFQPTNTSSEAQSAVSNTMHLRVLACIESLFLHALNIEEVLHNAGVTEIGNNTFDSSTSSSIDILRQQIETDLRLSSTNFPLKKEHLIEMIQFLNFKKGIKVISKITPYLTSKSAYLLLRKILCCLEYVDVISAPASAPSATRHVNFFINNVIFPFIANVNELPYESILELLQEFIAKKDLSIILFRKTGIVISCVLLNRLEQLMGSNVKNEEFVEQSVGESFFKSLEDAFLDVFNDCSLDPEMEYYVWQFYAFLAGIIPEEKRKSLVFELRDKIISTIQTKTESSIKNLNLFLNALGLDASQINV